MTAIRYSVGCGLVFLVVGAQAQFVGAALPRVNAAAFAGGSGAQPGYGFQMGGGRGIYGVTRRTFMGDANAVAAGYFSSAGLRLPAPAGNLSSPSAGAPYASWPLAPNSIHRLATGPTQANAARGPDRSDARLTQQTGTLNAGLAAPKGLMASRLELRRPPVSLGAAQANPVALKRAKALAASESQAPPAPWRLTRTH